MKYIVCKYKWDYVRKCWNTDFPVTVAKFQTQEHAFMFMDAAELNSNKNHEPCIWFTRSVDDEY